MIYIILPMLFFVACIIFNFAVIMLDDNNNVIPYLTDEPWFFHRVACVLAAPLASICIVGLLIGFYLKVFLKNRKSLNLLKMEKLRLENEQLEKIINEE